jgi:NAD-dependent deacetylase
MGLQAVPQAGINEQLIERLLQARSVAVLTGAGVSAESGIPTFRDAQTGLWARYDPGDLATPEAFDRNPRLVWEWYDYRRGLVAAASPNSAHMALAALERRFSDFTLITQNVDGLHERAGSRNMIELHGNITRIICARERTVAERRHETGDIPPRCLACGGLLRPDVVWFGEPLPPEAWEAALAATQRCDVFLSVGTSGIVRPAADLPLRAKRNGAYTAEINLELSLLSDLFDVRLHGPAGWILPAIVAALERHET